MVIQRQLLEVNSNVTVYNIGYKIKRVYHHHHHQ